MENRMTAVEWLYNLAKQRGPYYDDFQKALEMEKEQHGETWDMALHQMVERGYVWQRAMTDFDDYWAEKRNATSDEGIDQSETYPERGS